MLDYEMTIPHDDEMELKAKTLVESLYADRSQFQSLDQFISYINYVRSYCDDILDITARVLLERRG